MGDFGDNFDVDPAAEFLAREQDELAGLEDDVKPAITIPAANIDSTNMNAMKEQRHSDSFEMINGVEQDILDISKVERNTVSPSPPRFESREEPEKIRKWREEQKTRLEEKDKEEEIKKEELRQSAKKELEDWYKHHEEQIAKTKATNRNAEKQFVAEDNEIEPGTEWERIAKLCDFNPKASKGSKDVSRMRSIILQLKQSPLSVNKA
ncbi:hypothetical protein ILUMI_22490 [Ignelater luminosus]|uniref:Clathrin light chain n=1 Tax=Ignelater luminosus TaxID=2038154 RepID=A0A8K0CH16_IGNLU|nr:hypothetical protein ILUMI_22490 [Ignelater luminosus]